jgi:two-component system cell cycle response regulator
VLVRYNGKEALEALIQENPTLVLTDIVMPEMDGYELCRIIKQNEKTCNIPVLLVTQLYNPHDVIADESW